LFIQAAMATMNVMVEDLSVISKEECRIINIESEAIDMLLFKLLEELIYFKDKDTLLLLISKISINEENKKYLLHAESYGERINPHKHKPGVDVKAVTLYRFKVEKTPSGWNATVVLDI
jgi:SHS2 domain-containing protein